jgi:hypothetical protein
MHTIFDSLVTKENDHTNLLRNVMGRYPQVAATILTFLIGREVSGREAEALEFRTQHLFSGLDGREVPDLLVEGPNFRCLIEAKIDPELPMTPAQAYGYKGCFESVGERYLCFLVPEDWKHAKIAEQVKKSVEDLIKVRLCTWRELVERLDETSEAHNNPILAEAISFWKWRFEVLAMSSKEKEFLNAWSGEQYSAFRKLEKSIDQTKKLFDARGYQTESETSFTESYGFYIKRGHSYQLWVGIWAQSPRPLSYGFHPTRPAWIRPNPMPVSPLSTSDGYPLWPLGPETWGDPEKIFSNLKSFLDSQQYD